MTMKEELVQILFDLLLESKRIHVHEPEGDQEYLDLTIDEPNFSVDADHTQWQIILKEC